MSAGWFGEGVVLLFLNPPLPAAERKHMRRKGEKTVCAQESNGFPVACKWQGCESRAERSGAEGNGCEEESAAKGRGRGGGGSGKRFHYIMSF